VRHELTVGVLELDAPALSAPGSMRHPATFPSVVRKVVRGAGASVVIGPRARELTEQYVDAARAVVDAGANLVTTNCGFTVVYQEQIAAAVEVPTVTSALLWIPVLASIYGARLGVLTFDTRHLNDDCRRCAGWSSDLELPIADVRDSSPWRALARAGVSETDLATMRQDLVATAERLLARARIDALLLECTGMLPFRADLERELSMPVFDVRALISAVAGPGRDAREPVLT